MSGTYGWERFIVGLARDERQADVRTRRKRCRLAIMTVYGVYIKLTEYTAYTYEANWQH